MSIAYDAARRIPPSTLRLRLREAREWRGLDQADMASALDVSRATVSNYERGITKPSKLQVNAWAVTCDVDVEWLKIGHEGNPTEPGGPLTQKGPATEVTGPNSLPELDSNQQPAGYKSALYPSVADDLERHRRAKNLAHKAVATIRTATITPLKRAVGA